MAANLKRLEFKQRYPAVRQGLFIVSTDIRLPKGQAEVNIGKALSDALCKLPEPARASSVVGLLSGIVEEHSAVTLTHLEILFTPGFHQDVIGVLLSQCRNRKICIAWPGTIDGEMLYYASPNCPEYYECNTRPLQDTYIIAE